MENGSIARYRLLGQLGSGGMGAVYKAQDTLLNRTVALKMLSGAAFADSEKVRRFIQEARTASSLNHPNILTIHEIGEENGRHFIAMEYVDGETLRERIHRGPFDPKRLLDIGIQVADGLSAAHAVGIVHRDIKPDNVMIRRDGYAKILDFGLAKLTEKGSGGFPVVRMEDLAAEPAEPPSEKSISGAITQPGIVMGTVGYMSPEQARGDAVDARSDLFSLGCVLYEMASGRKPFDGPSGIEVLHKILKDQPRPLREINPDLPQELQRIIRKSMAKDVDDRYQTAKDLAIDLRELRREIETGSITAAVPAVARGPRSWRERISSPLGLVALVILMAVAIRGLMFLWDAEQAGSRPPVQALKVSKLTATGLAFSPALSPDRRYVAYVEGNPGELSLWVRQLATGSSVQVLPPGSEWIESPRFTSDSNWVLYLSLPKGSNVRSLWQVPTLGGLPRKLVDDVDSAVSFGPGGRQFVFVRQVPRAESQIVVAEYGGTAEPRVVTSGKDIRFVNVAWSPDGKEFAVVFTRVADPLSQQLGRIPAGGGPVQPVGSARWAGLQHLAWHPDGKRLLVNGSEEIGGTPQLWFVALPGGDIQRLTNDLNSYEGLSLSGNGRVAATAQFMISSRLWKMTMSGKGESVGRTKMEVTGGTARIMSPNLSPDGSRVAYASDATGNMEIWTARADGSEPRQLTQEPSAESYPRWSPDGTKIAFNSSRSEGWQIWVMEANGTNPRQLTRNGLNVRAAWSPDSRWLVYETYELGQPAVKKISVDGGEPVVLSRNSLMGPAWSPDGKAIAGWYQPAGKMETPILALLDAERGALLRSWPDIAFSMTKKSFNIRWMPDGRSITYETDDGGLSRLINLPLTGQPVETVASFGKGQLLFGFDWQPDGKAILISIGSITHDIVLVENLP